ncbi:MAG: hypothetical protein OXE73_04295 [Gammaproteobacteria bacterium]|nr:hypothetical protein [Gammaproteobacteria bacterium]
MAEGLGGTPAACTVTGYYRTSIFEYPASYSGDDVAHTVYSVDGIKAAIASDLPRYFERSGSLHYSIDVSVGFRTNDEYTKALEQASDRSNARVPLFLIVEEFVPTPPTALSGGQCYSIEEVRDGQQVIEGGREGKTTLLAIKTADGPWPDTSADPRAINAINAVLVAVKSELDATDHIAELCSVDCFVTDDGRAVYPMMPTMSATARVTRGVNSTDVAEGADRMASMLEEIMSDSEQVVPELLDSLVLGESRNDEYLRLWYLRLWEALKEAKAHLDGGPTPDLTEHRNAIAHWRTAKIDYARLQQLQRRTMALLRRKY